jgi:hypothetical protein
VSAGAFDRPGPQPAAVAGEVDQVLLAADAGGHGDPGEDSAGADLNDCGAVGMPMGADSDDDPGDLLQICHAFIFFACRDVTGSRSRWKRQDCDGHTGAASPAVKLLIRPNSY